MLISLNILYEALGSQFGVVLQCEGGTEKVRQKLYALRTQQGDPDLDCLTIAQSPSNPQHLWIVKRTSE